MEAWQSVHPSIQAVGLSFSLSVVGVSEIALRERERERGETIRNPLTMP